MKGCDSSSKARKWVPEKRRNVPSCWREPFASSATRSLSHPQTKLRAGLLSRSRGGFSTECNGLFYKGECQGKYLSLDRSRKTFPWLPAPLTIEDAGLVLCPSDLGAYVVPSQQMHLLQ